MAEFCVEVYSLLTICSSGNVIQRPTSLTEESRHEATPSKIEIERAIS
jgi:hypothetical protein